jgi:hypothetical protein
MKKLRPTPAGVIACLALAIALGGSAFAATMLVPKNSVGSAQVINGSLQKGDLSKKAVAALRGNRGPRGFQGVQGDPGVAGPTGPKGDKGDKGDVGPSNAYEAIFCSAVGCPGATGDAYEITASTLASAPFFKTLVNLPAGDYVVSGQVTIVAATSSDWRVDCGLRVPLSGPGWAGGASATVGDAGGDESETSLPILFGARVTADGTTLGLNCSRSSGSGAVGTGGNPLVTYADFIATKVGTLHQ